MITWEREPPAIETDFALAEAHFESILNAITPMIRTQVAEHQDTTGTNPSIKWQTMAYKIHEYIQQLASARAAKNATDTAANVQTTNKLTTMEAEIKRNSPPPSPTWPTKNNGEEKAVAASARHQPPPNEDPLNMKAYCSSHGFHPVGLNHDSTTCSWKERTLGR